MKILVVHLLRLGDFVMAAPVFSALQRKYPQAEIDVLTFTGSSSLQTMLPEIRTWWTLDRDQLQAGLGQSDLPMLFSYQVLKERLDRINEENYDQVINLSHTAFSGWIAGYIRGHERLGLAFDKRGVPHFHSPWFRYLDQQAQVFSKDIFHYTDLFLEACELKGERDFLLRPTERGEREYADLKLPNTKTIVLQTQTSDSKKNWSAQSWREFISVMAGYDVDSHFVLLGSPQEANPIFQLYHQIPREMQNRVSMALISLEGVLSLLNRADILITGDTSIKHLANAARTRVVEISLGSSDYLRTGIYKKDSLIVQAQVACAPCQHSASCSQKSHLCGESLSGQQVAEAVRLFAEGNWKDLSSLRFSFKLLRTHHLDSGLWIAADLQSLDPIGLTETLLERCSWRMLLNQEQKKPLAAFGSTGVKLDEDLAKLIGVEPVQPLLQHLDFLEGELENSCLTAGMQKKSVRAALKDSTDTRTVTVTEARILQNRLDWQVDHARIKQKLVRTLKDQMKERL